ncbi:MAG: NADH-quinone oxidoreductase subunit B family protein [Candidatus Kariarchaeaceae archaeon]|jgi:F420-non-reducing hydrogenase small subunit
MSEKLKIAFHWLGSCGGCEISLLDIDEAILDVGAIADIVFMPLAVDGKWEDVVAMEEGKIDIAFINGNVRNDDNVHEIEVLRQKSKLIVAYGQCSVSGGVIGLGNVFTRHELMKTVYEDTPSTHNPDKILPQLEYKTDDGDILKLPKILDLSCSIDQFIDVDYYLAGCPPPVPLVVAAVEAIKSGKLPPKGSYIGPALSVCDECTRTRNERKEIKIEKFSRPHEVFIDDEETCLIEQGIVCMGPATRGGCGGACPTVNMPCRGCAGPTPDTFDPATKMFSVLSQFAVNMTEQELHDFIESVTDPVGTFYRYYLPKSIPQHALYKEVQ